MIYTKEALETARLKVVGRPNAIEQAYIDGWNDALEAVMNNFGACVEGIQEQEGKLIITQENRVEVNVSCPVCGTELWIDSEELQREK